MRPTLHPIKIILPNEKVIMLPHICIINIPWLLDVINEAHIVPGLVHQSLTLTCKFCNAGCKVMFDEDECRVYYQGKPMLTGERDPVTELQHPPINPTALHNVRAAISYLDLDISAGTLKVRAHQ